MTLFIIGIILFIGLVLVHEWGHYIVARRNGVEVEEFGLFFPPRAKVLTVRNGTKYTLNWLPLGGFVKMKGENDADTRKGTFGAASTWSKTKILLAGVAMNLVVAFVMFTILAWVGMPKMVDNQFTIASDTKVVQNDILAAYIDESSPAAKAGIERGDTLLAIGRDASHMQTLVNATDLPKVTEKYAGEKVLVQYQRDGAQHEATIQLRGSDEVEKSRQTDQPKGYLGVVPTEYTLQRSTWSAPVVGAGLIGQFTALTMQGLGSIVANLVHGDAAKASEQVSGPVGIFVILKDGTLFGFEFVLFIIAIISLSLAIMNALPIPALDGGRLAVMLVARALKRPLTKDVEDAVHGIGFLLLIGLIILISVVDVRRFF